MTDQLSPQLTEQQLTEIQKACDVATPAPWTANIRNWPIGDTGAYEPCADVYAVFGDLDKPRAIGMFHELTIDEDAQAANCTFTAKAREWIPALLAHCRALQAERDEARAAVGCVNDMLEVLNERAARLREEAVSDFKQRVAKRLRASGDEFGAPEYYAAADIIESLPAVDKEVVTDASSKEA